MTANIAFSLCAALASLLIVVLAGVKGDWAVAAVYGALVLGFFARAWLGRRPREEETETPPVETHARRLKRSRFRRR
jgi:hypothetical protein